MQDPNNSKPLPKLNIKGAGRPKGTPNGDYKELFEMCRKRKIDVFEELLHDIKKGDPQQRSSAIRTAMDYLYTKRKAVEISGSLDVSHDQENKELREELLKNLK